MLSLNLISQELKREIKLKYIHAALKKVEFFLVFFAFFISIIFFAAKFFLIENFNQISKQKNLISIDGQNYNIEIKEINTELQNISKIQEEFIFYSALLKIITDKIPKEINLTYLKIDQEKEIIKIKGRAEKRDVLLKFKEDLNKMLIFNEIDFPIKNILEKTNIDFEINAKFNLTKFLES